MTGTLEPAAGAPVAPRLRLLIWGGAAISVWAMSPSAIWGWRIALAAALYAALALVTRAGRVPVPGVRAIDAGVDLLAAAGVATFTGGFHSPYATLSALGVLAAQATVGGRAGLTAAVASALLGLVHLRLGRDIAGLLGWMLTTGALAGASALMKCVPVPAAPKRPAANAEGAASAIPAADQAISAARDAVALLDERTQTMRSNYREVAAAVRDQRQRIEDLTVAQDAFMVGADNIDPDLAMSRMVRIICDAFRAGAGALWLMDEGGECLRVAATVGPAPTGVREGVIPAPADIQASDLRRACELRIDAATRDLPADPDAAGPSESGPRILGASLRADGRVVGVLVLSGARSVRFRQADPQRLSGLSAAIGCAAWSIQARRRLARLARENALMHEMSELGQSAAEPEALCVAIVDLVLRAVEAENCSVLTFDPATRRLLARATRGRAVNLIDQMRFGDDTGATAWAERDRRAIRIDDLSAGKSVALEGAPPAGVRSFAAAPMQMQEGIIGAIVISHSAPGAFGAADLRALNALATQAAATLHQGDSARRALQASTTDALTGLVNQRFLLLRLEQEVRRTARGGEPLAALILEIDGFADLVERNGRSVGSLILAGVAETLRGVTRDTDIVARSGGSEFALIAPNTSARLAGVAAERLAAAISRVPIQEPGGAPIHITVCVGVAVLPDHATDRDALLRQAGAALREARLVGPGTVRVSQTAS